MAQHRDQEIGRWGRRRTRRTGPASEIALDWSSAPLVCMGATRMSGPTKCSYTTTKANTRERERERERRRTNQMATAPSRLLALSLTLLCMPGAGWASPPVDYFIYTSQLATAQVGVPQNITSILPSIKSIYAPSPAQLHQAQRRQQSHSSDKKHQQANATEQASKQLNELADRVLALVRNTSHSHDNDLADLASAQYAWSLMERQAEVYMKNRVLALRPFIQELLAEASISRPCQQSIGDWLDQLAELKHWSTLMWNSWGQFPAAGIFQGSYTDLGSYSGCMSIQDNELIGTAQYCTLDFQPIVPARPRFHSIFKQILGHNQQQQLNHGDFELDPSRSEMASEQIGSRHTAHEFASNRFKELVRSLSSLQSPTLASAQVNQPNSSSSSNNNNKYLKRTIDQSTPSANQTNGLNGESQHGPVELNITLKAEALIELAKKAQYFYYVKFRIGACLPSKCSEQDVKQLAQSASQRAVLQSSSVNCMKKEPFSVNTYQLVAICILSVLALIAILGAVVDLLGFKENPNDSSALINWLMPFSIWTNAKRLFDIDTAGTHGDLECVHGLRFFSMLWVIYGHTILYMEYQSFTHFYDVVETQIPSLMLLPSLNANFSVDTFFVISGILTTYVTWEYTKGDARKFNKFAFMISRYIRLTPQLAIVILCFFILPLFGDGPMYRAVADNQAEVCYKNWWINLLYLQSYINAEKHCIDPSWWLSNEMTFHVVSVVVIIVMINNPTKGMWVNFLTAAALTLAGAVIHYTNGFAIQYLPSIPQRYEIRSEQTLMFFHRPYPHAASYFIGIALGYVLANRSVKKLSPSQLVQGWTVCALGLVVCLWGTYYWNLGAPYTQLQATVYYNLCQILWPISIAWVILACSLGHGGFVDSILSARCFVPLGRITYMTYLSHSLIIYYHSARMNMTVEPSMLFFTYLFLANTMLALILGVILTVVYESPILNLQKQLFSYLTQKFDPTARDAQCLATRLPNGHHQNGLDVGLKRTMLISEDDAPNGHEGSRSNGFVSQSHDTSNGFQGRHQLHHHPHASSGTKMSGLFSATAQCLLLDQNNDKHQGAKQQQEEEEEEEEEN